MFISLYKSTEEPFSLKVSGISKIELVKEYKHKVQLRLGSHTSLSRASSDSRVGGTARKWRKSKKSSVARAWLKFQGRRIIWLLFSNFSTTTNKVYTAHFYHTRRQFCQLPDSENVLIRLAIPSSFQEDIERALTRKPGNLGFYKNLNELMHHRMREIGQQVDR